MKPFPLLLLLLLSACISISDSQLCVGDANDSCGGLLGQCVGPDYCGVQEDTGTCGLVRRSWCEFCLGTADDNCNGDVGTCLFHNQCVLENGGECLRVESRGCCQGTDPPCNGAGGHCFGTDLCSFFGDSCDLSYNPICECPGTAADDCGGKRGACSARTGVLCDVAADGVRCAPKRDGRCCTEGTPENSCLKNLGSCFGQDQCRTSNDGRVCELSPSSMCFCQDSNDGTCQGDLGWCSGWDKCAKNAMGQCTTEASSECCRGIVDEGCGGTLGICLEEEDSYCNVASDGLRCELQPCFCTGTPDTNCNGDLDSCLESRKCTLYQSPFFPVQQCLSRVDSECTGSAPAPTPSAMPFCEGDATNDCNGDFGLCRGQDQCTLDAAEDCSIVETSAECCQGSLDDQCDGNAGFCFGDFLCHWNDANVCELLPFNRCASCRGSPSSLCGGDLGDCFADGECVSKVLDGTTIHWCGYSATPRCPVQGDQGQPGIPGSFAPSTPAPTTPPIMTSPTQNPSATGGGDTPNSAPSTPSTPTNIPLAPSPLLPTGTPTSVPSTTVPASGTGSTTNPVTTTQPTNEPTKQPTTEPMPMPTRQPTNEPTQMPTRQPTDTTKTQPTDRPTAQAPAPSPIVEVVSTNLPTRIIPVDMVDKNSTKGVAGDATSSSSSYFPFLSSFVGASLLFLVEI